MVTLRCTASLLKRLRSPVHHAEPSGRLGDWYARTVFAAPRHVVLCTNERSLLSVVVPLAPMAGLLERFVSAAGRRIAQIPAPLDVRRAEKETLAPVQLGRSMSRSVVSTMNEFMYSAESWLAERPRGDLDELAVWLCDTPCTAISTHWPWLEAELLLTGAVAPGRRPLKSPLHLL